jgi:hypothetical protein
MSAIKKHSAVFPEISNLVIVGKKNVSGIVYVPLTARLRAAYSAAYVAAYVVSPGKPTSRFLLVDDIGFVFKKSFIPGFPVSFLENHHRNYFHSF